MGVEPISMSVCLGIVAVGALALYLEECDRERERRIRCEEDSKRWRRQQQKEARRREREREREEREREEREREEEREAQERQANIRWELRRRREEENERRENELRYRIRNYSYSMESSREYYPSPSFYYRETDRDMFFTNKCGCSTCNPERERPNYEDVCKCPRCQPVSFNPFEGRKNSITVTFIPPQTTQDKNKNAKPESNKRSSSSNGQGAATSNSSRNASTQKTSSAPKATPKAQGSQQPQRNNNNNNNNSNNINKKDTVEDYGNLNDFIKKLKAVLDRCNASAELREKILAFFKKFEKHEENFIRILDEIRIQNIDIEDVLSVVIRLFQSDYFAADVAYENLIALMEIVTKYIKDELMTDMVKEGLKGNKLPFEELREECMKKLLQRNDILTALTDLFEKARKDIVEDNTSQPLDIDFSGIFTKVYHYLKHKVAQGKELTVTEYFDWIRKLLTLCKALTPEFAELTSVNHPRQQICFEVYSTAFQGRFRLVIRAHGSRLRICTFYLVERSNRKANDGDQYVDGKKKP